jgi:Arc/MetJ family transcription regulator
VATNLGIDEKLLAKAQKIGGEKTKKSTVNSALREYIQRRQQLKAIELFGTIDFDPDYDYKRERRRKRGGAEQ